jgi:hypothetical protein
MAQAVLTGNQQKLTDRCDMLVNISRGKSLLVTVCDSYSHWILLPFLQPLRKCQLLEIDFPHHRSLHRSCFGGIYNCTRLIALEIWKRSKSSVTFLTIGMYQGI